VIFFEGSFLGDYMTAVNHDNGFDWWLVRPVIPSGFVVGYQVKRKLALLVIPLLLIIISI